MIFQCAAPLNRQFFDDFFLLAALTPMELTYNNQAIYDPIESYFRFFIYFSPFLVKDDALQKHVKEKVLKNKKLVRVLAIKFGG